MYNRYIPQPDGSFRRRRMPDMNPSLAYAHPPRQQKQEHKIPYPPEVPQKEIKDPPEDKQGTHSQELSSEKKIPPCQQSGNIGSFLKNLLPKDFDTGDFFVLLLLLLMAGDCEDDKNTALLTLMLYLFM